MLFSYYSAMAGMKQKLPATFGPKTGAAFTAGFSNRLRGAIRTLRRVAKTEKITPTNISQTFATVQLPVLNILNSAA